jgi:hypothetical protein
VNTIELSLSALPLLLMLAAAPIGSLDVIYYHLWKFRLYDVPTARAETVTHLLRGMLFSAGAYLIATYRFGGLWFWAVGALFLFDFVNNVIDVVLEPRSRRPLGGVPGPEQLIHVIGSSLTGAITVAFFVTAWRGRSAPTALLPALGSMPDWLIVQGQVLATGGALLTLVELTLFLRSLLAPRMIANR